MAEQHGFLCVEDLSMVQAPPTEVVYTRLRVLGPGAALRASALERLAVQLALVEEAVVVIEGRASGRARGLVARAVKDAEALLDEEDDGLEEHEVDLGEGSTDEDFEDDEPSEDFEDEDSTDEDSTDEDLEDDESSDDDEDLDDEEPSDEDEDLEDEEEDSKKPRGKG